MSKAKASICVMIATMVTVMTLFFLPKPSRQIFMTTRVSTDSLPVTCMLEGQAVYSGQQILLAPVSGRIARCHVQPGDHVQAGELILRLDSQADEEALAVLESSFYQLEQATDALRGALPATDLWMSRQQQRATLVASIKMKQIRSDAAGIVENLYVQPGDYVAAGTPLGRFREEKISVSAIWTDDGTGTPAAGMRAYWCADDGTPQYPMTLESVALNNEVNGYILTFSFDAVGSEIPEQGEKAPVLLTLKELPSAPLIPLDALDDQGQIWIVEDGRIFPLMAATGIADRNSIQVSNLKPGTQIILQPDQNVLMECERVRSGADL